MNDKERQAYAERILQNPLWDEVMQRTKDDLYRQLQTVDLTDYEQMQAIASCAQWLDAIQNHLKHALSANQITEFNLAQRKRVI